MPSYVVVIGILCVNCYHYCYIRWSMVNSADPDKRHSAVSDLCLHFLQKSIFPHYGPFDITRKDIFCLAFYFKWKCFVLIDHILSETICLFCFCVLFSNIYPKIRLTTKNWSGLCNFYITVIFWNFFLRRCFLLFFAEYEILIFYNNIVKTSEKLNKLNLLKICLLVTYPTDFCFLHSFLLWEKAKIFDFLKTNDYTTAFYA